MQMKMGSRICKYSVRTSDSSLDWTNQFDDHQDEGGHEGSGLTEELAISVLLFVGPFCQGAEDDHAAPDEHGQIDQDHESVGEAEHTHDCSFPGVDDAVTPGHVDVDLGPNVED